MDTKKALSANMKDGATSGQRTPLLEFFHINASFSQPDVRFKRYQGEGKAFAICSCCASTHLTKTKFQCLLRKSGIENRECRSRSRFQRAAGGAFWIIIMAFAFPSPRPVILCIKL